MGIKITFDKKGEFQAYYEAGKWCKDNGISQGSMERGNPIGLFRGDAYISKWSHMTKKEQSECHGTMTSPHFRCGPVFIEMKPE